MLTPIEQPVKGSEIGKNNFEKETVDQNNI
jgi:hypothetical protein